MKPVWIAAALLVAFALISWDDTRTAPVDTALSEAERLVRLEVREPRLRRFDTTGTLVQTLDAPRARDFDAALPSQIEQPDVNWPLQALDATADLAELDGNLTRLTGNAKAQQQDPAQQLFADVMVHDGETLTATGNVRMESPSATGESRRAVWSVNTQILLMNEQVQMQLWPVQ